MRVLRTPDERFTDLPDYPFMPNYLEVDGLRLHYVDEGPKDAPPVLLLHGEPSWSYLYRHMIPPLAEAGYRVLAPDLIGFGKSDKPARRGDYTYERHVRWVARWLLALSLKEITLVCQDWGGLIGLRLVAGYPDLFARVVAANTVLPTGEGRMPPSFKVWQTGSQLSPWFPISRIVNLGCTKSLSPEVRAAYDAPFPSGKYKAGLESSPHSSPRTSTTPKPAPIAKPGRFSRAGTSLS